jgi:hypothetical protein
MTITIPPPVIWITGTLLTIFIVKKLGDWFLPGND